MLEISLAAGFPPRAARVEPREPHFRSPHPFILGKASAPHQELPSEEGVAGSTRLLLETVGAQRPENDPSIHSFAHSFFHSLTDSLTPSGPPCCVVGTGHNAGSSRPPTWNCSCIHEPQTMGSSLSLSSGDRRGAVCRSVRMWADNTDNVSPGLAGLHPWSALCPPAYSPLWAGSSKWPLTP